MTQIRVIYSADPGFPATDQHPDAVRYIVGGHVVDAIGGKPSLDEINAVLNPPPNPEAKRQAALRVLDDTRLAEAAKDPAAAQAVKDYQPAP